MSAMVSCIKPDYIAREQVAAGSLSWLERSALAVGIWEIPLQLDKYLFFREEDSLLGAVAGANVSLLTFALLVLYPLWVIQSASSGFRIRHQPIFGIPMLIYLAFVAFSGFAAEVPILTFFDLFNLLQGYGLFFYLANRVRERRDILFCLMVLVAIVLTQSVLVFGLASLGSRAYGQRYDFGPLSLSVWEDGRIAGSLVSAVLCGSVLAFLWLPIVALTLSYKEKVGWWLALLATLAGTLAVILTQTRGALLTMLIGASILGGALLWRSWLPRWTVYSILAVMLVGIVPFAKVVQDRVLGDDSGSAESRTHLSLLALELIRDRPLFGYGSGNCHLAAQSYADQSSYRGEWYYTIHSKYLLTWVETGFFGLVSFLALLFNAMRYGISAWLSRDPLFSPIGLAIAAGLLGSMTHMAVDIFNSRAQVQILWAVIGIAAAIYRTTRLSTELSSRELLYGE